MKWRDYVDMRFEAEHRYIDSAYQQMEKRLDSMNEFREQLRVQGQQFVNRPEFEQLRQQGSTFVSRAEFDEIRKLVYMALGISALVVIVVPVAVAFVVSQ